MIPVRVILAHDWFPVGWLDVVIAYIVRGRALYRGSSSSRGERGGRGRPSVDAHKRTVGATTIVPCNTLRRSLRFCFA